MVVALQHIEKGDERTHSYSCTSPTLVTQTAGERFPQPIGNCRFPAGTAQDVRLKASEALQLLDLPTVRVAQLWGRSLRGRTGFGEIIFGWR